MIIYVIVVNFYTVLFLYSVYEHIFLNKFQLPSNNTPTWLAFNPSLDKILAGYSIVGTGNSRPGTLINASMISSTSNVNCASYPPQPNSNKGAKTNILVLSGSKNK